MTDPKRPSPRQEALAAILETQAQQERTLIPADVWEKLIALAWDNRAHVGDRREIRRQVRAVLLAARHRGGEA